LEGLEKFGDDWNAVAEHIGTKTNEQCVLQFLRMPIEDSFLGDQLGKWAPGEGEVDGMGGTEDVNASGEHKFAGPMLPFADTANPIMAQVAFLASSVSPEVAAAAAQAALSKIMCEMTPSPSVIQEKQTALAKAVLNSSSAQMEGANGISSQNNTSTKVGENGVDAGIAKLRTLPNSELDQAAVEAAAAVGLAAAVARARKLADAEIREIEREFAIAVETKLRAVDLKLKEFDALEQHVRTERARLEKQRQQVYADRVEAVIMKTSGQMPSRTAMPQGIGAVVSNAPSVPHVHTGPATGVSNAAAVAVAAGRGLAGNNTATFVPMQTDGAGQ